MKFILITFLLACLITNAFPQLLKVGVAGLNHDHAYGLMEQYKNGEVSIIGIAEPNKELVERYKTRYHLPDSIFFNSVTEMLNHIKPDAVLAYNAIADHLSVVEACAPKGISVMVEKPLATTNEQVEKMAVLKDKYHIQILTNYETTWYPTNQQIFKLVNQNSIGQVRKMTAHDGHQGPVEIHCSKEFLAWLTDSVKNGAGALNDFGCYGADLMTCVMQGKAPVAVTAITHHFKPKIYPNVNDDDATITLEYATATGLIEGSWNWPFGIKDFEVFGDKSYLHALNGNTLERRDSVDYFKADVSPIEYKTNLLYLAAALKGQVHIENDPSSFETNVIVVKILNAAKESAHTGKKVYLK